MKEIKENFWADYKEVSEQIKKLDSKDERYKMLLERQDNIRNELIKLEQIEAENKREKLRTGASIATLTVTTCVGVWTVLKTFKFDSEATITSTLGRNTLNNVVSKMFKR